MLDQEDEGTRIGVWVTLGVLFFVLTGVIGGVVLRHMNAKKGAMAPGMVAVAPVQGEAPVAEALLDGPISGDLVGTLFFAVGAAAMPADAQAQVDAALKALAAAPGKKLVLSGFHDASGDPAKNAELAKQRAMAARDALKAAGVDPALVALRKPESTTGDGNAQEARRVEIRLVD